MIFLSVRASHGCCNTLLLLSGLKQPKCIILQLWWSDAQNGSSWATAEVSEGLRSFGRLQRRFQRLPCFCLFWLLISICSCNRQPLPCSMTYSQDLEIRLRTPLGNSFSASHTEIIKRSGNHNTGIDPTCQYGVFFLLRPPALLPKVCVFRSSVHGNEPISWKAKSTWKPLSVSFIPPHT